MTLTQQRRDQLDATAETLTDLGLPSLAAKLRDVIDELLPTDTTTVPSWSPVVAGWAEHKRHGRVLVFRFEPHDGVRPWSWVRASEEGGHAIGWAATSDLSAPVPRVWDRAEDVPAHVVVTDRGGDVADRLPGGGGITFDAHGPWTEVLPVGGVW